MTRNSSNLSVVFFVFGMLVAATACMLIGTTENPLASAITELPAASATGGPVAALEFDAGRENHVSQRTARVMPRISTLANEGAGAGRIFPGRDRRNSVSPRDLGVRNAYWTFASDK
jgi:hypothetical protein